MTSPAEYPVAPQRTLAQVLRGKLRRRASSSSGCDVLIGKVTAAPDSKHVTVQLAGATLTVPRLASYTAPVAGEGCYLLAADSLVIALGAVR